MTCRADCSVAGDCNSGYCYDGTLEDVCSECAENTDCGTSQECDRDAGEPYATCKGTLELGVQCSGDDACASGFCNTTNGTPGICSECNADGDCFGDGTCTDDTGDSGYFICTGGLGDDCDDDSDCNAPNVCYDSVNPLQTNCSECSEDSDCGGGTCDYSFQDGYASCS